MMEIEENLPVAPIDASIFAMSLEESETVQQAAVISKILTKYRTIYYTKVGVKDKLKELEMEEHKYDTKEHYKNMFSLIDLTTLSTSDTEAKVRSMVERVNDFKQIFKAIPSVGAICIYPPFVPTVCKHLHIEEVGVASVSAGFPSSQTFIEVKALESQVAVRHGATEIDIVISVGTFLAGDLYTVFMEIYKIKKAIFPAHLKVILETGAIKDINLIRTASLIAMEAGADFIKTSTGKMTPAATPDAVLVMAEAIKEFGEKNGGKQVGIKPAGGISTADDALTFYTIITEILGKDYQSNALFRIGASRLANSLLSRIFNEEISYF